MVARRRGRDDEAAARAKDWSWFLAETGAERRSGWSCATAQRRRVEAERRRAAKLDSATGTAFAVDDRAASMTDALGHYIASPAKPACAQYCTIPSKALVWTRIDHFQIGYARKAAPAMLRHALQRAAPAAAAAARTDLAQPKQRWHLIDASQGVSVGRLAAAIAPVLRGKHKPGFEPHRHEHGDNVVVVNADRLVFTGRKWKQKL